ncbi:MAG: response regulator, partial [Pyrinomonadaceae bacterium]|nr:response regulator [Sphingobacteriaceae bacterium]
MKKIFSTTFRSFRGRILLSFLCFKLILFVWIAIYFFIDNHNQRLYEVEQQVSVIKNEFSESKNHLQKFLLSGYHQSVFYTTLRQPDIDNFIKVEQQNKQSINNLIRQSKNLNLHLDNHLSEVSRLNKQLIDSVQVLRSVYLKKGFKNYGTEGMMRSVAHIIEDSLLIERVEILQLRRSEKDFLIRGEEKYALDFNENITLLLNKYKGEPHALKALKDYQAQFNILVAYYQRIGILNTKGLYVSIQTIIQKTEQQYVQIKITTQRAIAEAREMFNWILIGASLILMTLAITLSVILSKILTRDIKELNQRMSAFIDSKFKIKPSNKSESPYIPNSIEVDRLNLDFILLQNSLKSTLDTLEKSYQELKQVSEYKSVFLANMSHEIRTPLNGIVGMIHLLQGTAPNEIQKDYLQTLEFSSNHLMDLLNMILDYSKIEAGKLESESIPIDMKGDSLKLLKLFEYKAMEKQLKLTLDYRLTYTGWALGDPLRLQQVLINLLNNSIKFTSKGGIRLLIDQIDESDEEISLLFEVSDTGVGISQEKINSLFEAFKQADTTTTRTFGGTGLGLTISKELVELMGGQISVKSKPGEGSQFSFTLRFKKTQPPKVFDQTKQIVLSDQGPCRILLAEDNLINQKVISMMLKKHNAEIDIANNGIEACQLFELNNYDLILMDIQMPEMDGY